MRAQSVGEYLILFGALIAVVATAVISLGRMVVFQAQTAEIKYSQSLADEFASVINEVSSSPDGSYFSIVPAQAAYTVTITPTQVILKDESKQITSTHLARNIIPAVFNSIQQITCASKKAWAKF